MPYMEEQFYAATGIRLEGLAGCTAWIKHGSYYHSVVAQRGQLDKCPHLVGIELPRGPQMMPSESCLVSQRKLDTPVTSSSAPATEASAPQGATADVPAPMETGGAGNGQNEPRTKMILKGVGQRNIHGHSQRDMKTGPPTPSHSRMRREGATLPRRYTGIWGSSHQLVIMWPPWGYIPPSGGVAARCTESGKPGALHDRGIPPCGPCPGLLEPKSGTPGGYDRVATSLG